MKFGKAFEAAAEAYFHQATAFTEAQASADLEKVIRAVVRAVVPGRQQKKNLDPLMEAAEKAATRALRRVAK